MIWVDASTLRRLQILRATEARDHEHTQRILAALRVRIRMLERARRPDVGRGRRLNLRLSRQLDRIAVEMRDRGWTLAQVGKIFGVSRERIRQRERAERRRRQAAQVVLEAAGVRG